MTKKVSKNENEELYMLQGENEELKASLQVMTKQCDFERRLYNSLRSDYEKVIESDRLAHNEITELNKHLGFYQKRNLWQRIINKKYGE